MAPSGRSTSGKVPLGQERVRVLYEEYIHYSWLKQVWDSPLSQRPELEPLFAAGFQGIELALLLMAQFLKDGRKYVAKRPRIEAMALNIRAQCQLLGELVDGELEEEGGAARVSLTQDFPFPGCPPTTDHVSHSPGLAALLKAVKGMRDQVTAAERNSMVKVVLQLSSSFQGAFQRWSVGLGVEHQLNALLQALDLDPRYLVPERQHNLDYNALVKPEVAEATLTQEVYHNSEDFFFRTIHLGTECWMFIANSQVRDAARKVKECSWHVASARIMQAARTLHYLGDHILTLTRMNLRDYLQLKVQLEGTSGAGSSQVRAIRGLVLDLMTCVKPHLLALAASKGVNQQPASHSEEEQTANGGSNGGTMDENGGGGGGGEVTVQEEELLLRGVMHVYLHCDEHAGLYNYCKALEDIESGLLGGFFYKHYCLATNVIGSESRGTMRRAVAALKAGYEKALFPVLDTARTLLGQRFDEELAHLKGRMMDDIMTRYTSIGTAPLPMAVQNSLKMPSFREGSSAWESAGAASGFVFPSANLSTAPCPLPIPPSSKAKGQGQFSLSPQETSGRDREKEGYTHGRTSIEAGASGGSTRGGQEVNFPSAGQVGAGDSTGTTDREIAAVHLDEAVQLKEVQISRLPSVQQQQQGLPGQLSTVVSHEDAAVAQAVQLALQQLQQYTLAAPAPASKGSGHGGRRSVEVGMGAGQPSGERARAGGEVGLSKEEERERGNGEEHGGSSSCPFAPLPPTHPSTPVSSATCPFRGSAFHSAHATTSVVHRESATTSNLTGRLSVGRHPGSPRIEARTSGASETEDPPLDSALSFREVAEQKLLPLAAAAAAAALDRAASESISASVVEAALRQEWSVDVIEKSGLKM